MTNPALEVRYLTERGQPTSREFTQAFVIGRGGACQIWLNHHSVSRQHLRCWYEQEQWWIEDLHSRNGSYVNGKTIQKVAIAGTVRLQFGQKGPEITLLPKKAGQQASHQSQAVDTSASTSAAANTANTNLPSSGIQQERISAPRQATPSLSIKSVKRAAQVAQRKQTIRYRSLLILLLLITSIAAGIAAYQYAHTRKLGDLALDMFYAMKTLELQVLNLQSALTDSYSVLRDQYDEQIVEQQQRLEQLQRNYTEFMAQLNKTKFFRNDVDRLILHVAQLFGEAEANAPVGFVTEVKRYIRYWRNTDRLQNAINRLQENGYTEAIVQALKSNQLPPQFIYLALQESNFRTNAVGPITRYGHAKGMWQFIPQTGTRYGLTVGPKVNEGVYDAGDERHDFAKSSFAAARYLRDIYRTDAQASGLLVMASYNWGEGNILRLLRQMPNNPRERNFWQLIQQFKIPKETYDYVFYIIAAAVIGENPQLFGFDFDNPLTGYE